MKNKKFIYIFGTFLVCLFIFLPKNVWAVTDYDGNGIITQDEKIRYYQEIWGVTYDPNNPQAAADELQKKMDEYATSKGSNSIDNNNQKAPKKEKHTHSYTATVTKEATCTEEGKTTYRCECGDSYTEPIPKKPHDYETTITKEPTCTEPGTQTQVCKNCGDTIETTIPALGHKPGDWTTEKEPTCTEEGKKVRYCTVCGEVVETMIIDKLPHTEGDWEVVQKPTLIKTGLKVKKCTICGEVLKEEVIPANTTLLYIIIGLSCAVLVGGVIGIITYKRRH